MKKIIQNFPEEMAGFYTEEIRKEGRRTGFRIVTLEGQEAVLADVNLKSAYRVSKYGVSLDNIDKVAVKSLEFALENKDIIIIDEIGKMECFSQLFKDIVLDILNSDKIVLATMGEVNIPFVNQIKARKDIKLFSINLENRDKIDKMIIEEIKQTIDYRLLK